MRSWDDQDPEGRSPPFDADEVSPGLFVGSAPPLDVAARGFHVLVLAAEEHQPPAERFRGVAVIHAPIDDDPSRPMTRVEQLTVLSATRRVVARLAAGERVLVTCVAGLNRSSLIAALAMRRHLGMDAKAVVRAIRMARGGIALSNQVFVELIFNDRGSKDPRSR